MNNPRNLASRWMRLLIALCCAVLLTSASVATALAHKPLFKNGDISAPTRAMSIPDPSVSWAIYANLDRPDEADYFAFHVQPDGLMLNATITIPTIDTLQQFAPHLALIGPEPPRLSSRLVPFTIPANDGGQLVDTTHTGTTDRFDEPFTQTTYWNRQTIKEPLRVAGLYYLVVFNRPGDALKIGKYVLAVGNIERFGPGDILTFPTNYFRVRFFAGAGLPLWSWIALVLIGLLAVMVIGRRHQSKQKRNRITKPVP